MRLRISVRCPTRGLGLEIRQHQALDDRLVFPVGHGVIVLLQAYKNEVYLLPEKLDEKVAKLQLPELFGNAS